MSTNAYAVFVEPYAERHFIKAFAKKYKGSWDVTWKAVLEELKRIDSLLETSIAETITSRDGVRIIKMEFRVAGTRDSRKASGNRCIVAVEDSVATVRVLLVYHKNDITGSNETAAWKAIVKENYPHYEK